MTFLLTVDTTNLDSIFKVALSTEITKSKLVKEIHIDTVDGNFDTYIGNINEVTNSLWYLLDECIPLNDFVCIAIADNQTLIKSGRGYFRRVFNPHIMFDDSVWKILPRYTNAQEFEQINNNL